MNDFNSRYRNLDDQPDTIRTNAGGYGGDFGGNFGGNGFGGGNFGGFDDGFGNDMDIMEAENAQKKKQVARASQARGGASHRSRKNKRQMLIYGIIIFVEVIALVVIWINYISYAKKAKGGSSKSSKATESNDDGASSGNINVDNDDFALTCTKISISTDVDGNPAALVYFTFVNKTENPLSMSQVYAPSFKQNGMDLSTFASLVEEPQEIYNKDSQVSNGQSIECAYAVSLQDTTSEITITMHDNYETFSDIGSTVVPLS